MSFIVIKIKKCLLIKSFNLSLDLIEYTKRIVLQHCGFYGTSLVRSMQMYLINHVWYTLCDRSNPSANSRTLHSPSVFYRNNFSCLWSARGKHRWNNSHVANVTLIILYDKLSISNWKAPVQRLYILHISLTETVSPTTAQKEENTGKIIQLCCITYMILVHNWQVAGQKPIDIYQGSKCHRNSLHVMHK